MPDGLGEGGQRAKAGTPSRLQQASRAPRVPLHALGGTMAGALLAGLAAPGCGGAAPDEEGFPAPPCALGDGVRDLDSTTAASYALPQVPRNNLLPYVSTNTGCYNVQ